MPNKTITRSTVNTEQYNAAEFSKSGFNLSYRDYNDYMLGRWHVSGFQWTMPSDKISGNNKGNFTFKRIVTPMVAPTHVGQYNVYVTLRSIDNTFQRNFAPSKHNGMSASWSLPMINTQQIVANLLTAYGIDLTANPMDLPSDFMMKIISYQYTAGDTLKDFLDYFSFDMDDFYAILVNRFRVALTNSISGFKTLHDVATDFYALDILKDIEAFIYSRIGSKSNPLDESIDFVSFRYLLYDALFTPFIGRYSYYADFGYNYLRPSDLLRLANEDTTQYSYFIGLFDNTPLNEYPLRAMYMFWYDRCRDVNLQPVSSSLPDPRDFGSTSVVTYDESGLMYLIYRVRRWTEDMFITAMPDSPSKYVFAPIVSDASINVSTIPSSYVNSKYVDNHDSSGNDLSRPNIYDLSYIDPTTGSSRLLSCPVPSFVNDAIARLGSDSPDIYQLQLQNLRQAQNLEHYLKRLDFFGDEYNDYMLGQYNSRVSDLRINHPEILSQSIDDANYGQEIANMSNDVSKAGDRTATGTISSGGDGYETFCEEFGIIINVITFMPESTYDGVTPQLLMNKLVDFPLPIFAANNDELGRIMEIAANGMSPQLNGDSADFRFMFGHYPAFHAWRSRVDRVRGCFLNEMQDCLFRRFYGMTNEATTPRLNYEFINCHPNLQMFANTVLYDCQLYGDVVHDCYVERVLPTPVESI